METVTIDSLPKKTRENYTKAVNAMERENLDYAIDILFNITQLHPTFFDARRLLRAAEIKKFNAAGGGAVTHVISNLTQIGTTLSIQSQIKNKPEQALKSAEKLLRADPLNKNFLILHSRAAEAADMPDVAIHSMETARDHYPKDINILNRLAALYADVEMTAEAKNCYAQVLQMKPNDPKALKNLKDASALDTMRKGHWEEEGDYRNKLKDQDESVRLEQAQRAVKTDKDVSTLIEEALQKVEKEPENLNYRRALAELYVRAGQYDEALNVLHTAQEMTGGGDPEIDRAISNVRIKQFDEEIGALEQAGDSDALEAAKARKDEFLMATAAERVRRYPNDLLFKFDYGVLLYDHGRIDEAIQQFQPAQKNPQKRIRTLYYLALCFKQKEQYDIAAEQLEKAASEMFTMDDNKKDIVYELGALNDAMGNIDKAVEYFKQIYAVDIGYKDVARKIETAYKK